MRFLPKRMVVALLALSLCACGRPPADSSPNPAPQNLPFDRQPRSTGVSPSRTLIPSTTNMPEGTTILIRIESRLSSASSHAGDVFSASVDEPIVIDGRTLIVRGTSAIGRVLEAKPGASSVEPGYLRIVLVSLSVGGKAVMIYTSSIFAKGGSREERNAAVGSGAGASARDKDVVFDVDRRLNFRLAQSVDLQ
jgi:hypothetical protein